MRNIHVWKTSSEEGVKQEVRAEHFGGRWRVQIKGAHDEAWTYFDTPPLEHLVSLRDVVWRKYQRKRLSWDDVVSVDALIEAAGGTKPEGGE